MEKSTFVKKIEAYIAKHRVLSHSEAYLVAVSGGADSVVLLRVMIALGYSCKVAHCNFHLRGDESVRDEQFVARLCQELCIECLVTHFDVPAYEREHGVSTEMACRELRYAWFRELLREHGLAAVVVAHHSDDNIETLFLNLLRGSGIAGMTAMHAVSGDVRRPLLGVSRAEIEAYAGAIGQDFVTDSTNLESVVKRNKLRNIVLPILREQFRDADSGILRTIDNMQQCNGIYRQYINELQRDFRSSDGSTVCIDLEALRARVGINLPTALFELIREYGFNSAQVADMVDLAGATGRRFLSGSHIAVINRGSIDVFAATADNGDIAFNDIVEMQVVDVSEFSLRGIDGKASVCFDAEILQKHLELRHWQKGDRFRPFGMKGSRLVSDVFSDLKLSEPEKRRTLLLTADGEIVWLLGIRSSAHYPVTPHTTKVATLSIKRYTATYR